MARCKNTTVFYVPAGRQRVDVKAVIQCTGSTQHESDEFCSAQIGDSNPPAVVVWQGSHTPPKSHG